MKEEIVIIQGEPRHVYKNGRDLQNGFSKWVTEEWVNPTGIRGEPQFGLSMSKAHNLFA